MVIFRRPFAAVLTFVGLVSTPAADAQTQSPAPPEQAQPSITDQKLDQTAAAIKRVASVKQDYQQRITAAAPSDKERIAEEGRKELAKAVTDQGLSVGEYDAILEVAQKDPDVLQKLKQRISPSAK
jgi:Domain of unknown function (DUF4168)